MGAVCEWVLLQDRPGELGPGRGSRRAGPVSWRGRDPTSMAQAVEVSRALIVDLGDGGPHPLVGLCHRPDRGVAVVRPGGRRLVERRRASSSTGCSAGPNTLYLCAPIEDQKRLAPAFGGLLNDLIAQAYRHVAETGKPLDPPLLIVIDEAGNTPLRALPEYASTLAGIGVLLVTIWQSLAQIEAAYRAQADTILTNHLTKVFYAGLSDPASLRYVNQVLGDAEVETSSRSGVERLGAGSTQLVHHPGGARSGARAPPDASGRRTAAARHAPAGPRPHPPLLPGPSARGRRAASPASSHRPRRRAGERVMKPFLRPTDRGQLAPVGWVSEPAGRWAGKEVDVVYDPRRHDVAFVRHDLGETVREGFRERRLPAHRRRRRQRDVGARPPRRGHGRMDRVERQLGREQATEIGGRSL